jgi:hypothetical protein
MSCLFVTLPQAERLLIIPTQFYGEITERLVITAQRYNCLDFFILDSVVFLILSCEYLFIN